MPEQNRREPTENEIAAGYLLTNERHALGTIAKSLGYSAQEYVGRARDHMALLPPDGEGRSRGNEWSRGIRLLNEAQNAEHLVGEAHNEFAEILHRRKVRTITNADFEAWSVTWAFPAWAGGLGLDFGHDPVKGYYLKIYVGGGGCR